MIPGKKAEATIPPQPGTIPGKAEVVIEAVVIRKDGRREDLGVVSRTKVEGSALKKVLSIFKKHGNRSN